MILFGFATVSSRGRLRSRRYLPIWSATGKLPTAAPAKIRIFLPSGQDVGYHTAMELRFTTGAFTEIGPATAWLRMRQPLVGDEPPTPLQRVLVAADVGNGISAAVDFRRFLFVNVDLTVQLERLPEGEWVCVDAVTMPRPRGNATAESVLSDERGRVGRAMQTLLVAER